jgi:ribonuclease BN (tRNA processing enzyme)
MIFKANSAIRATVAFIAIIFGMHSAAAQQHVDNPTGKKAEMKTADHSTRIILLGTGGGPIARKYRSQPANLVVVDGRPYLVDAGAGVGRQLAWAGFQPSQLNAVFITHHHIDHNAGLGPLMSFIWMGRNTGGAFPAPIQIYGPAATKYLVGAALDYLSVSERIFSAGIKMKPAASMFVAHDIAAAGLVYQDDKIRVTAAENTHFSFKSGTDQTGQDKSYAYRFDTPGRSIVFTGDTGPSDAVTKLADGADVLVSEVIDEVATEKVIETNLHMSPEAAKQLVFHMVHEHLAPEEVGKLASRAHVGTVLLTHFSPGLDTETDMTNYTAGVRKYFSGPVIAGKDLLEY